MHKYIFYSLLYFFLGNLSYLSSQSLEYNLLHQQLDMLFEEDNQVSTTRRGAGFSIALLHIVKQDAQKERPLLAYVLRKIFLCLERSNSAEMRANLKNCDIMHALVLHYLCVLVKDAELRSALLPHYNDIMLAAIQQIDNAEWTVCNAALQLFGALVPKIVGQKQAIEFETATDWQPTEVTYVEILNKMPKACQHILQYCAASQSGTRSIILYLSFLAHVEHLQLAVETPHKKTFLKFRTLLWQLLSHGCEKVRKLAATCFVRAHELRYELPHALLCICKILLSVEQENFFIGLVFTLKYGIAKLNQEALHTLNQCELNDILQKINDFLRLNFDHLHKFKPYTLHIFMELQRACNQKENVKYLQNLVANKINEIGYDLCTQHLNEIII